LGDQGEITADCFVPHQGSDSRPADRYLSVHWLEYLGRGSNTDCLAALRAFLMESQIPAERRPTRNGKLAMLACDPVCHSAPLEVQIEVNFEHQPRTEPPVATSIEITPAGELRIGVALEQVVADPTLALDPHSGLFTLPEEAAHQLAVQAFLASKVIHTEPGRLE
jgi:hypothetical protein